MMKIYNRVPLPLIRLSISKRKEKTLYLNFCETTQDDCIATVRDIIAREKIDPFAEGISTRLDFRDCLGGKNGVCKSVSFKGLTPQQVYDLLVKTLDDAQ